MWIMPLNRRGLVDLLGPGPEVTAALEEQSPALDFVRGEQLAAVWPVRPDQFGRTPATIIVSDAQQRDSLAWLSTYVRDLRPFTAFCRVVSKSVAEQFMAGPAVPCLLKMEGVCAGLVLGEALSQSGGRVSILDLPSTVYSGTLSHAIGRTLALTGSAPLKDVTRAWVQARDHTGQNELSVPPGTIQGVWGIALGAFGVSGQEKSLFDASSPCAGALADLVASGEIGDLAWNRLIEGVPEVERLRLLTKLPREQRLEGIDRAIHSLIRVRRENEECRSFLAGYFASLLAPGSLEHADVMSPIGTVLPAAYLWYGLFAGIAHRGDGLPSGPALGRWIVRDLTLPDRLIDRPRCDIALEEITTVGPAESLPRMPAKAGRLDIDILPGVTTSLRWPPHHEAPEDAFRRRRDAELEHLSEELQAVTSHQRMLAERLREILGAGERTRPSASPSPKRKKGS